MEFPLRVLPDTAGIDQNMEDDALSDTLADSPDFEKQKESLQIVRLGDLS